MPDPTGDVIPNPIRDILRRVPRPVDRTVPDSIHSAARRGPDPRLCPARPGDNLRM